MDGHLGGQSCPQQPPSGELCTTTCGNGMIDACYTAHPLGEACTSWSLGTEVCDGNTSDCTAVGYLAGTAACNHECTFDISTCTACETTASVLECRESGEQNGMSVTTSSSGPELALTTSPNHISLYGRDSSGLVPIVDLDSAFDLALPYPNGWIMSDAAGEVTTLDANGTPGSVVSSRTDPGAEDVLAYGAGGRVLQASTNIVQQTFVTEIRIFDTSVNLVVPPTVIAMAAKQTLAATSDGTSFFVMTAGQITRIAPDGTVLGTTSGYPIVQLGWPWLFEWGTTGGWFVGTQSTQTTPPYEAQRFDATGAKVGGPIEISDPVIGVAVDGDDLLLTVGSGMPAAFALERITPAGAITTSAPVGVWDGYVNRASVVRFGPDLVVSWLGANRGQLARVAF